MISKEDLDICTPASRLVFYRFEGNRHIENAEPNTKSGHLNTKTVIL